MNAPPRSQSGSESLAAVAVPVESDLQRDAARALEMLHIQLISTLIDPYWWKWVLVALHHGVETFLSASLSRADHDPAAARLRGPESFELLIDGIGAETQTERPRVLEWVRAVGESADLALPADFESDLRALAEYRQVFLERIPVSWALAVNPLPRISQNCLQIVDRLGWNPGTIRWSSQGVSDRARVKFLASLKILDALEEQYRRRH